MSFDRCIAFFTAGKHKAIGGELKSNYEPFGKTLTVINLGVWLSQSTIRKRNYLMMQDIIVERLIKN